MPASIAADGAAPEPTAEPKSYQVHLIAILIGIVLVGLFLTPVQLAWSWVIILGLMTTFILVAGKQVTGLWRGALIDERNKISLARLQLVLWTTVVLSAYLCSALSNVAAGVDAPLAIAVPKELWIALGISTASLIGSPLIKAAKKDKTPDGKQSKATIDAAKAGKRGKVKAEGLILENESREDASWADIFTGEETGNGSSLDLSKIQMFFFTAVIVIAYAFAVGYGLAEAGQVVGSLPDIDPSMNMLLGISHTGYLTHKGIPLSKEG